MGFGENQAWVTFVQCDKEAKNAIALAASLHKTFTRRKLIVLYGPLVSSSSRKQLSLLFDEAIRIGKDMENVWLDDLETFAKVYLWSIPFMRKIVYLSSNCLVLKNCDQLFKVGGIAAAKKTQANNKINTSILIVTPSQDVYDDILEKILLQTNDDIGNKTAAQDTFEKYLAERSDFSTVDDIFNFELKTFLKTDNTHHRQLSIVQLPSDTERIFLENNKNVEKFEQDFRHQDKILTYQNELLAAVNEHFNKAGLKSIAFRPMNEPIAIVGMSCRWPGANNVDEFWDLMINRVDATKPKPADRWRSDQGCILTEDSRKMNAGFLKCPIDEFDGDFFGYKASELSFIDPQHRLLMEVTWEALEDAACNFASLKGSNLGIFSGAWLQDYYDLMMKAKADYRHNNLIPLFYGNWGSMGPARISQFLDVTGPCLSISSACTSGLISVGMAMESLRNGTSNMALASGINILAYPTTTADWSSIMSPDGRCKTFDSAADGFGRAEGCGVLVLKRMSDAIRDNDKIYAQIRGYGGVQEGLSKKLGVPTVACETLAMKQALVNADVHPSEVNFIEVHGTGTYGGDAIELKAITNVYSTKNRSEPLVLGSVKPNIGHTESASGMASIIKTVLSMQKEVLPPLRKLDKLNPLINLNAIPAVIPLEPFEWKKNILRSRIAGISAFGASGADAHVILEEAPNVSNIFENTYKTPFCLLKISAKTKTALESLLSSYEKYFLQSTVDVDLHDITYTSNIGRADFKYRVALVESTSENMAQALKNASFEKSIAVEKLPKVCFVFTGQTLENFRINDDLYKSCEEFQNPFEYCNNLCKSLFNICLKTELWGTKSNSQQNILVNHLSNFVAQYSISKLWEFWGVRPDSVMGHSRGEFAAAVIAGIVSVEDALKVIQIRCNLIEKLPAGGMIQVGVGVDAITHILKIFNQKYPSLGLGIAAINSTDQTILTGSVEAINTFSSFCNSIETSTQIIDSKYAYHSRDMEAIAVEYKTRISMIKFSKPTCEYISGVDGKRIEELISSDYWVRHTTNAVNFKDACQEAYNSGARVFLEVGSSSELLSIINSNIQEIENAERILCRQSINNNTEDWKQLLNNLGTLYVKGVNVDWENFYQFRKCNKVSVPHYPFQRNKYWFDPSKDYSIPSEVVLGEKVHPLVGVKIDASGEQTIFENYFNLKSMSHAHATKDGSKSIVSTSSYLEMALAAGYASYFSSACEMPMSNGILSLKNVHLGLSREMLNFETYQVHTTVNPKDELTREVSINSRTRTTPPLEDTKWIFHCKAQFSYSENINSSEEESLPEIKARISKVTNVENMYAELENTGYNIGSKYKVIKNIWKNDSEFLVEVVLPQTENNASFHCNSEILEAMLQLSLNAIFQTDNSLHRIICIEELRTKTTTNTINNYVKVQIKNNICNAVAFNENGEIIMQANGIQFQEEGINNTIQDADTIQTFVEKWVFQNAHAHSSKHISWFEGNNSVSDLNEIAKRIDNSNSSREELKKLDEAIVYGILRTFTELGWTPTTSEAQFELKQLMKRLNICKEFEFVVKRMLNNLTVAGYLKESKSRKGVFKVKKQFPSILDIKRLLENSFRTKNGILKFEWECVLNTIKNWPKTLTSGKSETIAVRNASVVSHLENIRTDLLKNVFECLVTKNKEQLEGIRILEIGAKNQNVTKLVLSTLNTLNVDFSYDFTNTVDTNFQKFKLSLGEDNESLNFLTLDIEMDPKTQGFSSHQYDIVIASDLHNTKNLKEVCSNIRNLTKNSGLFLMAETFVPQNYIDFTSGHLDKYHKVNDLDLRPEHPVIDSNIWESLLKESNFSVAQSCKILDGVVGIVVAHASGEYVKYNLPSKEKQKLWILVVNGNDRFSDNFIELLEYAGRTIVAIKRNQKDYLNTEAFTSEVDTTFEKVKSQLSKAEVEGVVYLSEFKTESPNTLSANYLFLLQKVLASNFLPVPKLFVVTRDQADITRDQAEQKMESPTSALLSGITKSFMSENPNFKCKIIDLSTNCLNATDLYSELWRNDRESLVAYREDQRFVARLCEVNPATEWIPMNLPKTNRFSLLAPENGKICDLKFGILPTRSLKSNEVEIKVEATRINSFDVHNDKLVERLCIGNDIAGKIVQVGNGCTRWKVGDEVIACDISNHNLCTSYVTLGANQLVRLPSQMTFEEGATFLSAFVMAYYHLIHITDLKAKQTLMINCGDSDEIGFLAVQIAKKIGSNIIVITNSKKFCTDLKAHGISSVIIFERENLNENLNAVLGNNKADVVLDFSKSSEVKGILSSYISSSNRYVEYKNYEIKEKNESSFEKTLDIQMYCNILEKLSAYLQTNSLKPIRIQAFDLTNIKTVLQTQSFKNTIFKMPPIRTNLQNLTEKSKLFNEKSTYLITGGTKGIGLEVAQWMIASGAKNLVLCSRNPPTDSVSKIVNKLNSRGSNIITKQTDISNFEECKSLFEFIRNSYSKLPPLRGIMHSAGCTTDALIQNQDSQTLENVLLPKVNGSWNLHSLSLDLPLEHFVAFSSFSAVIGSPGQANYAGANAYLDALVSYRNTQGLPAISINWGQWAETGLAVGKVVPGIKPISTQRGIKCLESILRSQQTRTVVCDGDVAKWKESFSWAHCYLQEIQTVKFTNGEAVQFSWSPQAFRSEMSNASEFEKKCEIVKRYICLLIAGILKLESVQKFEDDQEFKDFGIDSLLLIEFRNHLQTLIGFEYQLTLLDMADCHSVGLLTRKIANILSSNKFEDKDAILLARNELVHKDSVLWPHIQGDGVTVKPSQVKTVLLTGATGFLGPYLLRNLTQRANIQKVYCLVRESKTVSAEERLKTHLEGMNLLQEIDISKVVAVKGDISVVALGINEELYESLSFEVEAVIHSAVYANHLDQYRKTDAKHWNLRAVNVIGTQRMLEFACAKRTKLVYNATTLFAIGKCFLTSDELPEHWPTAGEFDDLPNFGYGISKHISDQLVGQANNQRSIPCKAFRFAKINGDTRDGRQHVKANHFFMKFLYYMKAGMMPSVDVPLQLTAVDVSADITLDVFFNDQAEFTMYNVINPHSQNEKELVKMAAGFGFEIKQVSYEEFVQRIEKDGEKSFIYHWKEFYSSDESLFRMWANTDLSIRFNKNWMEDPNFFARGKIQKLIPNLPELIEEPVKTVTRDVQFAIKHFDIFNK